MKGVCISNKQYRRGNLSESEKIYFLVYGVLIFMLFFAVICEFCGKASFFSKIGVNSNISVLFNTNSIKEVCKAIGLGSLSITWIYKDINRMELGISYGALVKSQCSLYHFVVCLHLIATVLCLWFCSCNAVESAGITLGIILWGCLQHVRILRKIILNPSERRKLVLEEWEKSISNTKKSEEMMSVIYSLADTIDPTDSSCNEVCRYFVMALMKNIEIEIKQNDGIEGLKKCLERSYISYQRLLSNKSEHERYAIQTGVFYALKENKQRNCVTGVICLAFVLFGWKECYSVGERVTSLSENNLFEIPYALDKILALYYIQSEDIRNTAVVNYYICGAYNFLSWILYLKNGRVPTFFHSVPLDQKDKNLFWGFFCFMHHDDVLGEENLLKLFDLTWGLMTNIEVGTITNKK